MTQFDFMGMLDLITSDLGKGKNHGCQSSQNF